MLTYGIQYNTNLPMLSLTVDRLHQLKSGQNSGKVWQENGEVLAYYRTMKVVKSGFMKEDSTSSLSLDSITPGRAIMKCQFGSGSFS